MTLTCRCGANEEPRLTADNFHPESKVQGMHIKASCRSCGCYIKFMPQTPEVLTILDRQIAEEPAVKNLL